MSFLHSKYVELVLEAIILYNLTSFFPPKVEMAAARARLPKPVRRYVQGVIRNFVFAGLTFLTLWQMSITLYEYQNARDVMKMYGFLPGRI